MGNRESEKVIDPLETVLPYRVRRWRVVKDGRLVSDLPGTELATNRRALSDWLAQHEETARGVLRDHGLSEELGLVEVEPGHFRSPHMGLEMNSQPWFAREVLETIERAREALRRNDAERVGLASHRLGILVAHAELAIRLGPDVLTGRKRRAVSRKAGQALRETAHKRHEGIVSAYRHLAESRTDRARCADVARQLGEPLGTVRDHIRKARQSGELPRLKRKRPKS